ncbi:MerR family DNA-binding transcriptional regulator [Stenotrophomonas sp.]|nr:MerR family DNA-binding transcriptional regulator [Stenotrophomonas sp.]
MRISEVSRLTGASAKAIRLYEARGLLPPVRGSIATGITAPRTLPGCS